MDGMLILAPDNSIERSNPSFTNMYGVGLEELQSKQHDDIIQLSRIVHGITLHQAQSGGWPFAPDSTLYVEGDLERPGR